MMRLMTMIALAGLLSPPPVAPPARAVTPSLPMCRRAAAIPALPPEAAPAPPQKLGHVPHPVIDAPGVPAPPPPPPPAPPPPPPPASEEAGADVVVTGSATRPSPVAEAPSPMVATEDADSSLRAGSAFARRTPSQRTPRAGLLTAGEHDDLLNPELYAAYVDRFLAAEPLAGVPRVDTRRVLTVAVRDGAGRPVPFAPVTLTCADGNTLTLATVADGTAVFFPGLDRLGPTVRVGVPGATPRRVDLSGDGAVTQAIALARPATGARALDLALVLDATGSMGDEIAYLQAELRAILTRVRASHPGVSLRVALIAYRDEGDEYVTRTYRFTDDLARLQRDLAQQAADGGGDEPEAVEQGLARAAALDWRAEAVKSLLWVADAPPHADDVVASWHATEALRAQRVQVVPVASSDTNPGAEYLMRAAAAATQSRYLFLTDDSGIGNPHAPPAIDCYAVTSLADAVRRVLDAQLSGRRIEPAPGEVIRTVGTYDAGRCVLPSGFGRRQ